MCEPLYFFRESKAPIRCLEEARSMNINDRPSPKAPSLILSQGLKGEFSIMKVVVLLLGLFGGAMPQNVQDDIAWFVHITDTHVSHIEEPSRISDLREFVTSSLAVLKPEVVICSGDLTNAKRPGHLTASQSEEEWQTYKEVVDGRWQNVTWLDIRGNHDNLDVISRNSTSNMFSAFSVQGRKGNLHSYVHQYNGSQKINFVGIDATWEVGMTFPFNFNGYLDEQEQQILEGFKTRLSDSGSLNIMFGHYPTSVIYQSSLVRDLLKTSGLVYMSGHLHDLMIFKARHLYTFHEDKKALELELADWKHNRAYRLFAIDHGLFSFIDVEFREWPVVLVTFPKDSRFWLRSEEQSMRKLQEKRQVRVLVFSDAPVFNVTIQIDAQNALNVKGANGGMGPLFTATWPKDLDLSHGLHNLEVMVTDANERSRVVRQTFTFDEEDVESFDWEFASLVLRSSFASLFHAMFALTLLGNLLTMLLLRLKFRAPGWQNRIFVGQRRWQCCISKACCLFKRLLIVCHCDRLFYPLLIFLIYMTVGPWVVGRLVEGRLGMVFAWGVVMFENGKLPSQTTFVWYCIHFALIHPVMVVVIGQAAEWRLRKATSHPPPSTFTRSNVIAMIFFLVALAASVYLSLTFWMHFGALGFFFGPLKTWSYIFYGAMIWVALTLPENLCRQYMDNNGIRKKIDTEDEQDLAEDGLMKNA